ncbi:MAG: choice-of-anchor L domain-containing protein, partial [Flavobacteriales bacterium]
MNRTTLSPLLICASFLTVNAQLVVTNTQTPAQLVQNVLMGGGVTATNITFNGTSGNSVDQQIASFNSAASNAGIPNGLILSTGNTAQAVGPNNAVRADLAIPGTRTDADLSALSGGLTIDDAAVLEFNFVPTGGSISFNFVFASEEYPGYVCGTVNDAFGFFLSGPGITGPFSNGAMNLALIPGTNVPVTINTVNSGIVGAQGGQAGNCAAIDPNW